MTSNVISFELARHPKVWNRNRRYHDPRLRESMPMQPDPTIQLGNMERSIIGHALGHVFGEFLTRMFWPK